MNRAASPLPQRALLSVSDKTNLIPFAKALSELNIEILSTGGTAAVLQDAHINVTEVSELTGFPEIMDGRIKTLHPKVYAGLLGRRDTDQEVMKAHDLKNIDILVVNLYPFRETIADPNCSFEDAIENIDIGGPAMIRAAAKNHKHVTVIIDPNDFQMVLNEINEFGNTRPITRFALAQKAFQHTMRYDQAIHAYLSSLLQEQNDFPPQFQLNAGQRVNLRYGENPHQQAAFYQSAPLQPDSLAAAKQLQGKELSYNNIADTDAAMRCIKAFSNSEPACAIIKHENPCGIAIGVNCQEAYERAYACDPSSSFGGIIAFNHEIDDNTATLILKQQFVEVIIAPSVSAKAQTVFESKPRVRVLACPDMFNGQDIRPLQIKNIHGGLLVQSAPDMSNEAFDVVSKRQVSEAERQDLMFAWSVVKNVKSNAIVYAKNKQTLGIGAGQTSRIFSAEIAKLKAEQAGLALTEAVMASDGFFPFSDSIEFAAANGISAIIQPGGSLRDQEVIDAADKANIVLVHTGTRYFLH